MNAIEMITAERRRQIDVEGWSPSHDDTHDRGQLARAAATYAMPLNVRTLPLLRTNLADVVWPDGEQYERWYFNPSPDDRVRELVKAGGLIVAEIERLQRSGVVAEPTEEAGACECGEPEVASRACGHCGIPVHGPATYCTDARHHHPFKAVVAQEAE